jgi:GLPGLI family protein
MIFSINTRRSPFVHLLCCFLLLLFFFAGSIGPVWAQEQGPDQEGVIRYLITHNWSKKLAAVEYISQQTREREAYIAGNRWEWKEYANLYFSPSVSKYEDSEERAEPDDEGYSWRRQAYHIRRDYSANRQTDLITALGKVYLVEDSIHAPNWKIHNDLKEVAGHLCMKAYCEDTLKMQKIVVWFALDMPLPAGPERLGGLPGLILEADVNNGAMTLVADKIEMKKLAAADLTLPKRKAKKVDEAGYRKVLRDFYNERRKAEAVPFWGVRY